MVAKISTISLILGIVLLAITSTSLIFSITTSDPTLTTSTITEEQYSYEIAALPSIREFENRIEIEIYEQGLSGIDIPILIDDYVRNKFYHEYSVKPWHDNWVLALVNTLIPQYFLAGNMKPEEIFRYDYGICNQQAILFQEIVRDFGFDYGSVRITVPGFPHFASAVMVTDEWYFFDPNLEPEYDRRDPNIFDKIIIGDKQVLTAMYGNHFDDASSEMIEFSEINTFPAARGVLVQEMSYVISWYGWALLVFPSLVILLHRRRTQEFDDAEDMAWSRRSRTRHHRMG